MDRDRPPRTFVAQQRAQAAELDALLGEVKGLKSQPQVATVSPSEIKGAIEASLAAQDSRPRASCRCPMATCQLTLPTSRMAPGRPGWPASNGNWAHAQPRSSSPARTHAGQR